jgi:hypothetical protein
MKIIDLLNKVSNGEEVPKNIKIDGINYIFDERENFYYRDNASREDLLVLGKDYSTLDFLNWNVELIEEDTIDIEGIEKIENEVMRDDWRYYVPLFFNKINELVQAVKQLNIELKEYKNN